KPDTTVDGGWSTEPPPVPGPPPPPPPPDGLGLGVQARDEELHRLVRDHVRQHVGGHPPPGQPHDVRRGRVAGVHGVDERVVHRPAHVPVDQALGGGGRGRGGDGNGVKGKKKEKRAHKTPGRPKEPRTAEPDSPPAAPSPPASDSRGRGAS
ncbi:hypothetical protein THAOC_09332, partial [Thalassiosira oceanica]